MPILDTPFAQLDLIRQPEMANEPLQAFDAADEYLLTLDLDESSDKRIIADQRSNIIVREKGLEDRGIKNSGH